jgi:hypothetical protein
MAQEPEARRFTVSHVYADGLMRAVATWRRPRAGFALGEFVDNAVESFVTHRAALATAEGGAIMKSAAC